MTDDPIVAIDDLTNTSSSFEKVRVVAADQGKRITRAFVVLDYDTRASMAWRKRHEVTVESVFKLKQFGLPLPPSPAAYRPTHRFEPLWSSAAAGGNHFIVAPNSQPVSDGKAVYVGTDGGELLALDAQSGERLWSFRTEHTYRKGIRSSPVLADGKVVFGAYNGRVYCLAASAGQEIWQAHEAEWVGSSPAISAKHRLVIIGLEHELPSAMGSIAAFDLATGKRVWEHRVPEYIHSSPVLSADEDRLFIGTNGNDLLCLETASGSVLWQYWSKGAIKAAVAVSESLGVVVAASHDRCIHLVEAATGKPIAIIQTAERLFASALIVGDVAYIGSPDKHLYVIDLVDGSVLKTFFLGSRIFATPTLLGGIVYVGTTSGKLFGIDPATLTFRAVLQVPERITNAPILVQDGTIMVVPTLGSRLFAFRVEGMAEGSTLPASPRDNVAHLKAPPISAVVIDLARADSQYFRIDEPVGRPVSRPYASMPSRRLLGTATVLMMHAPRYKDLSLAELRARVAPALVMNQARIFLYGMQPVGLVTWARLNEQTETRMMTEGGLPNEHEWSSGDRHWIIDVIAPFGGGRSMLDKVRRETLAGRTVRLLQPHPSGGFETVTLAS